MPTRDNAVLVLDIGTTMLKASLIDVKGHFLLSARKAWHCDAEPEIPGAMTFQPKLLLHTLYGLSQKLMREKVNIFVQGIIVSTQRLGFVLLDDKNEPLEGIPNVDRRAVQEALSFQTAEAEFAAVGRWPGAQHLFTRLTWWRKHRPAILDQTAHIVSIGNYVSGAMTGIFQWEPTTACETALLDIHSLSWRSNADAALFGSQTEPGRYVGPLLADAASMGLPAGTPVLAGAGDTQLGVLGAGGIYPGDMVIVAGSSAPVNAVLASPQSDPNFRIITNPHVLPGRWVMEANAMMTGVSFQWVRDILWDHDDNGYQQLNDMAKEYLFYTGRLPDLALFAGASLANARKGNGYPACCIRFSMQDMSTQTISRSALALAAFESAVYAMLGNVDLLAQCVGTPHRLYIGGGETRMPFLTEFLAALSPAPLFLSHGDDLTCLGAAMLAWYGLGRYDSIEKAAQEMAHTEEVPRVDIPHQDEVHARMNAWIQQLETWKAN